MNEELKTSQVHLRDQAEYIEELKMLVVDLDTFLRDWIPSTYEDRGILLQERMRELGIKREGQKS